jgi:hypothetical protein
MRARTGVTILGLTQIAPSLTETQEVREIRSRIGRERFGFLGHPDKMLFLGRPASGAGLVAARPKE